jgi:hypothetical protein
MKSILFILFFLIGVEGKAENSPSKKAIQHLPINSLSING